MAHILLTRVTGKSLTGIVVNTTNIVFEEYEGDHSEINAFFIRHDGTVIYVKEKLRDIISKIDLSMCYNGQVGCSIKKEFRI
jgi:hypothetical protein